MERGPVPVAETVSVRDDILLKGRDWLFVFFLLAIATYVVLLILAYELHPEAFAVGVTMLDALPLDPFCLVRLECGSSEPGPGLVLVRRINLLVLPTLVAGLVYNTIDLRHRLEALPLGNWLFSLISLAALPALLVTGCPVLWQEQVLPVLAEGIAFAHAHTAAAAVYAIVLLSLCNSVTLIPAAVFRWIVPRRKVEVASESVDVA